MKNFKLGANSVVFILFFGLALIEALRGKDILKILVFLILGIISLLADSRKENI